MLVTRADVALGVVLAAVLAGEAVRSVTRTPGAAGGQWLFDLVVGLVICATALLRGRNRAWAAVIGLAAFGLATVVARFWHLAPQPPLSGSLFGLLVLGAAAVRTLPTRVAATIGGAGLVVVTASEIGSLSLDNRAFTTLLAATLWAGALAAGLWLRSVDARRDQALDAVRRDERIELARELHDVVAHHVTGIVVQAQAAKFTGTPEQLVPALDNIETAGLDTLAAIRQLVGLLRDPEDTSGTSPVPEPVSRLVERFARHGPAVDLRLPAEPAWPPEVTTTVYRIVQEALTNITRHAPGARSVTVTVTDDHRRVGVEITDDAPAGAHGHGGGYGLVGMRERVEALGGQLRAGPRPGTGWAVNASLPVRP